MVCWWTSRHSISHGVRHYSPGFPPPSAERSSSHSTHPTALINLSPFQKQPQWEHQFGTMALSSMEMFPGQGAGCLSPTPGHHCSPGQPVSWRIYVGPCPGPRCSVLPYLLFITTKWEHIVYDLHSRPFQTPGGWLPLHSLEPNRSQATHSPCATATLIAQHSCGRCLPTIPISASLWLSKCLVSV